MAQGTKTAFRSSSPTKRSTATNGKSVPKMTPAVRNQTPTSDELTRAIQDIMVKHPPPSEQPASAANDALYIKRVHATVLDRNPKWSVPERRTTKFVKRAQQNTGAGIYDDTSSTASMRSSTSSKGHRRTASGDAASVGSSKSGRRIFGSSNDSVSSGKKSAPAPVNTKTAKAAIAKTKSNSSLPRKAGPTGVYTKKPDAKPEETKTEVKKEVKKAVPATTTAAVADSIMKDQQKKPDPQESEPILGLEEPEDDGYFFESKVEEAEPTPSMVEEEEGDAVKELLEVGDSSHHSSTSEKVKEMVGSAMKRLPSVEQLHSMVTPFASEMYNKVSASTSSLLGGSNHDSTSRAVKVESEGSENAEEEKETALSAFTHKWMQQDILKNCGVAAAAAAVVVLGIGMTRSSRS